MKRDLEILKSTRMTESDAKRHLKNGVIIYEVAEYLENFDSYTEVLEDDEKKELKEFLRAGKSGMWQDNDLTEYDGVKYYIEYCL